MARSPGTTGRAAVRIPGGEVLLGSPGWVLDWLEAQEQAYSRDWFADEVPQVSTLLRPYEIDRDPVTVGRFARFTEETGYRTDAEERGYGFVFTHGWEALPGACWRRPGGLGTSVDGRADHPVVHISYRDARSYAAWRGRRLPTEAEWELAARGYDFRLWPWGDEWSRHRANTAEHWAGADIHTVGPWSRWWRDHRARAGPMPLTTAVGAFDGLGDSAFGVSDMAGNVYEWTSSLCSLRGDRRRYDPMYLAIEGVYRVVRGGSWMNLRYQTRCAERIYGDPDGWSNFATGFRCAGDVDDG
ncbi:formylglycine-generating enzyme family protein [Saccharothrix stipae]